MEGTRTGGSTNHEFSGPAYETFIATDWSEAWKLFLELDERGIYKFKTSWDIAKYLGEGKDKEESKKRAEYLYTAIGPSDKANEKCPYLGDWDNIRSSLFIGELNKQSILFGNPRVSAIRKLIKEHLDVMEVAAGLGDILVEWLGRFQQWSQQVDEHFNYKLFDPKLSDEENDKRFESYTRKQHYLFRRVIDATRQVLKCFGVNENDVALLTQMMIATMRGKLGETTASMMMSSVTGQPVTLDGNSIQKSSLTQEQAADQDTMDDLSLAFHRNPQLKLMLGTFVNKATTYQMAHPDVEIPGNPTEDLRTDPKNDQPKTNGSGKKNGKAVTH
jgi:hypothetical protein